MNQKETHEHTEGQADQPVEAPKDPTNLNNNKIIIALVLLCGDFDPINFK